MESVKQDGGREGRKHSGQESGEAEDASRAGGGQGAAETRNLVSVKGQTNSERCAKDTTNELPEKTATFGVNELIRMLCESGPCKLG